MNRRIALFWVRGFLEKQINNLVILVKKIKFIFIFHNYIIFVEQWKDTLIKERMQLVNNKEWGKQQSSRVMDL